MHDDTDEVNDQFHSSKNSISPPASSFDSTNSTIFPKSPSYNASSGSIKPRDIQSSNNNQSISQSQLDQAVAPNPSLPLW